MGGGQGIFICVRCYCTTTTTDLTTSTTNTTSNDAQRRASSHLDADGLAPRELPHEVDEVHQPSRAVEGGVDGRRVAILPYLDPSRLRDGRRDLAPGENASVPRLGTLRQLDLDHLPTNDARKRQP